MNRNLILLLMLSLDIMRASEVQSRVHPASSRNKEAETPTIAVTMVNVSDEKFEISCEIRNLSKREVWICDDIGIDMAYNSEIRLTENGQLLIRRRLEVPSQARWVEPPRGRYVRLDPGERRLEFLTAVLPIDLFQVFDRLRSAPKNLIYLSSVTIEIGYYEGNFPQVILDMTEVEATYTKNTESTLPTIKAFGNVLTYNFSREQLRDRNEEIIIPYTYQQLEGEKVLRTTIDGFRIPCQRRQPTPKSKEELRSYYWANLALGGENCTKLEILCEPSALEHFFPFPADRDLLSREEIEYLRSQRTFVVEDQHVINPFLQTIMNGEPFYGIIQEKGKVLVRCYHDSDQLTSFTMYSNVFVETSRKSQLSYVPGALNLSALSPEIEKLEHRVQCAVNLRDLYYRMRQYFRASAGQGTKQSVEGLIVHPTSSDWLDFVRPLGDNPRVEVFGRFTRLAMLRRPNVCPSVGEGRSTYATNPNCKADSPADMVLLFETEDGWKQHGGPELFTFNNHDPRGGCVLLNDGTVKFIRTKEELQQLRWK